ncbi:MULTISPECIES: YgiT-type zinc finger protein [unclassified Streptomyces]|uniref:YgiT-type zinc finger protein n=1 Tax=unclassified Streptomyces TaxID=2593676 RepID=UPI00386AEE08|nr:YgiT-type zinc finger protein [Streptomyces sp. NBC_00827]
MATPPARDPGFGLCPCGGLYNTRRVEVRMTVTGRTVVIPELPQGACPTCGSRVYKVRTLELLEVMMRGDGTDHDQETRATG